MKVTFALLPTTVQAARQHLPSFYARYERFSTRALYNMGYTYLYKRQMADSALVCFSIIANRKDSRQLADDELRSADLRVHLDLHHPRVNPVDRSAITLCQHFVRTFLSLEDANIIAIIDEKRIEPNSRQPQDFSRLA